MHFGWRITGDQALAWWRGAWSDRALWELAQCGPWYYVGSVQGRSDWVHCVRWVVGSGAQGIIYRTHPAGAVARNIKGAIAGAQEENGKIRWLVTGEPWAALLARFRDRGAGRPPGSLP